MKTALAAVIGCILLAACSPDQGHTPVPRRTAFPRVCLYDSTYTSVDSIPVNISLNSALTPEVKTRQDGSIWLTAEYPAYNATLYVTATPVNESTVESIVDNRTERIHLNINGAGIRIEEMDNAAGYHSNIIRTVSPSSTPLQFLAVNAGRPRWVVYGSVFFGEMAASTPLDSIAPVYEAINRDIRHAMRSLSD